MTHSSSPVAIPGQAAAMEPGVVPGAELLPAAGAARQHLVLLHGWGCNREIWRPLVAALRPWADVTLVDIPGCAPGLDKAVGQDLAAVLDGILAGCRGPVVLLGWSLGGQLALALAARYPRRVRAVITVCSNPRFVADDDWPGMPAADFHSFYTAATQSPDAALRRFDSLQVAGSRQSRPLLRALRNLRRDTPGRELIAGLDWLRDLDYRQQAGAPPVPVLHLLAANDALVPAAVAQHMSGAAEVIVLPDCSHLLPLQAPRELAAAAFDFIARRGLLAAADDSAPALAKTAVAASFSRAAGSYDSAAHLQREVGAELMTRLAGIDPAGVDRVLDLGCGTGYFRAQLQSRFPDADYLGLDLAEGMVTHARRRGGAACRWLVADAEALPLAAGSVDLVYSSLALQWCCQPRLLLAEIARILAPGGMCVFTSLGPETLRELRVAWAAVDANQHVNSFLPVAALTRAAAAVPGVALELAVCEVTLHYPAVRDLLAELKALGAHNMNRGRPAGLTSRRSLQGMLRAYEQQRDNGLLPATYEVIYGRLVKP